MVPAGRDEGSVVEEPSPGFPAEVPGSDLAFEGGGSDEGDAGDDDRLDPTDAVGDAARQRGEREHARRVGRDDRTDPPALWP